MTHFNTAFSASSKSDSAFDDLSTSLGDPRPHHGADLLDVVGDDFARGQSVTCGSQAVAQRSEEHTSELQSRT